MLVHKVKEYFEEGDIILFVDENTVKQKRENMERLFKNLESKGE